MNIYRFCGKEKDEESGLYYYGLRYYNPWTCRFINIDPLAGKYPFYTPYQYAGNKPINFIDLDGGEPKAPDSSAGGQGGAPSGGSSQGYPSWQGGSSSGKSGTGSSWGGGSNNTTGKIKTDFSKVGALHILR